MSKPDTEDDSCNQDRCIGITSSSDRRRGKVKWYDAVKVSTFISHSNKKGFGFITDTSGEDVFVFLINIFTNKDDKRRPVLIGGEEVEFSICQTRKGLDAREVSLPGGKPFPS